MKIAELSSRSGTSVASIKFYLRENLLPAGTPTGRNQAEYGEEHLHRLRLIRALVDVGGLSISAARDVLAAVDTADLPDHAVLGAAHHPLARPGRHAPQDGVWQRARAEVTALVGRRGWHVNDTSAGLDQAADAIAAMRQLGQDDLLGCLETYADAAQTVAAQEVATVVARGDRVRMVEGAVVGTILGEALFNAIRRLAQQDASARLLLSADQRAALSEPSEGFARRSG